MSDIAVYAEKVEDLQILRDKTEEIFGNKTKVVFVF